MNASSTAALNIGETPHDTPHIRRRDWQVIALVGVAHSCSHFFQLMLPALFLPLSQEFGYGFAHLGLLVSIFFLLSGIGQAISGFVVDRVGAAPVLLFGLASFVLAAILMGAAQNYPMLMLAAVIGGLGNAVFHPADFAILNHRVSVRRLGHAFSTHGFTGSLGWAVSPLFMATFIHWADWRVACLAAAALFALVLAGVWLGRHVLVHADLGVGRHPPEVAKTVAPTVAQTGANDQSDERGEGAEKIHPSIRRTLSELGREPALWGAFGFFFFATASLASVQSYTIPMLTEVYRLDMVVASTALAVYMAASALGMIAGGFLVHASVKNERVVALSLIVAGTLLAGLATGALPAWLALGFVTLGGFCAGVSSPSRDMLVRRATPKHATGTVYGLVYSGMDAGSAVAPVAFGALMDAGHLSGPWYGAAVSFGIAAYMAWLVARWVVVKETKEKLASLAQTDLGQTNP